MLRVDRYTGAKKGSGVRARGASRKSIWRIPMTGHSSELMWSEAVEARFILNQLWAPLNPPSIYLLRGRMSTAGVEC